MKLLKWPNLATSFRRAKRRILGCCLLLTLALLLACGTLFSLTFYLAGRAGAQEPHETSLAVLLLIDNSNSMFGLGSQGSDPDLLRIEAARLFIEYLGVDSRGPTHHLGVISFGGEAQLVVPLTPLKDDARRRDMAQLIADPMPMAWTNPSAALELAEQTFEAAGDPAASRAVVLLTDGKPELSADPSPEEQATTIARLRETAGRFAAEEVPLFIVLLQNAATDADPEIEQVYVPLWREISEATPQGRFFRARQSEDLLGIYHDIVVALTGRQTVGVVVQTQVQAETVERVPVEPGLAQVTFVVRKSDPALQVTVFRPNGRPLVPDEPDVQYGGRPGQSREEVWAVSNPPPGAWQVRLTGQGTVTVWKDFYPAPPAVATVHKDNTQYEPDIDRDVPNKPEPTAPTPSPSPSSTASPSVTPTASATRESSPTPSATSTNAPPPVIGDLPRLTLVEPATSGPLPPGDPWPVEAAWLPGASILAYLESPTGERLAEIRLSEADNGRYSGQLSLPRAGEYQLRLQGEVKLPTGLAIQDEASLTIISRSGPGIWWWIELMGLLLAIAGVWFWFRRWQAAPLLAGSLRRIATPGGQPVPARVDLDALRRPRIVLGPDAGADVQLPHAPGAPTPTAHLLARPEARGEAAVALRVVVNGETGAAQVNRQPVVGEWSLRDGDLITLGAYHFRYENLRRRAPAHRPINSVNDK